MVRERICRNCCRNSHAGNRALAYGFDQIPVHVRPDQAGFCGSCRLCCLSSGVWYCCIIHAIDNLDSGCVSYWRGHFRDIRLDSRIEPVTRIHTDTREYQIPFLTM